MSTIHNPVNFEPTDYSVVAYIDNQPPRPPSPGYGAAFPGAYATACDEYAKELKAWRDHIASLNVQGGIHRCCHCGNGSIRYVTVCLHKPTGRNVAFGTDCTERLSLPGASEFKAKYIRTAAANAAAHAAKLERMAKIVTENPGLADALTHTDNTFIADVARRFEQYGELSEAQISAVIKSAARDAEFKARREAEKASRGPVPVGQRITFSGVIKSRKVQEGMYGMQHKCLIKLDNGSAIWMTEPASCNIAIGDVVTIRASVEASKDDPSFGFAKRPHFISSVKPLTVEPSNPDTSVS